MHRDYNSLSDLYLSFSFFYFSLKKKAFRMQLANNNNNVQTTLLTLQDAINDSPVYRSSSLHFDEQLDLLEKWLDSLSKHMKQYTEKLNSKKKNLKIREGFE